MKLPPGGRNPTISVVGFACPRLSREGSPPQLAWDT